MEITLSCSLSCPVLAAMVAAGSTLTLLTVISATCLSPLHLTTFAGDADDRGSGRVSQATVFSNFAILESGRLDPSDQTLSLAQGRSERRLAWRGSGRVMENSQGNADLWALQA